MKKVILIKVVISLLILTFVSSQNDCDVAYPNFGTVICQGATPPEYSYPEEIFQGPTVSTVSYQCISDCMFERKSWLIDSEGNGFGQGDSFCDAFYGLNIDISVGNQKVYHREVNGGDGNGEFPITFDRNSGPIKIEMSCCGLDGCKAVKSGSKAKFKETKIWLYDGNPGQPVPKQVQGSNNCVPNSFVKTHSDMNVISGQIPNQYFKSSNQEENLKSNFENIEEIQDNFDSMPLNMRQGQTFSYLYGWESVDDINVITGKNGNPVGYCGGYIGDRSLYSYSKVTTALGACYLIPSKITKNVECCYNEDCNWKDPTGKLVCNPDTFTCTNNRPCNSDLDCDIIGEESCFSNIQTKWTCDFSKRWEPYKGTCIKEEKEVSCCLDNDCPENQYCDIEKGCIDKYKLVECSAGRCCLGGGSYKPQSCSSGLVCCTDGNSKVGDCKTSCNEITNQNPAELSSITGNVPKTTSSKKSNNGFLLGFLVLVGIGGGAFYYLKKKSNSQETIETGADETYCKKCGESISLEDKFCIDCGKKV